MTATVARSPSLAAAAALPSATRLASPTASRLGSTTPTRIDCPAISRCRIELQVGSWVGHPRAPAAGSGTASTTGLVATGGACWGTRLGAAERSRTSQVDESGTHTSGTATGGSVAAGAGAADAAGASEVSPARATPARSAMASATSAGSAEVTSTATHSPSGPRAESDHRTAACASTGAISGAAAMVSRDSPEQVSSPPAACQSANTPAPATMTMAAMTARTRLGSPGPRWRPPTVALSPQMTTPVGSQSNPADSTPVCPPETLNRFNPPTQDHYIWSSKGRAGRRAVTSGDHAD